MARKHIKVAGKVFQWRVLGRNRIPSDDHILDLAQAIQRGEQMPPILVFPVGQDYYVMDGHHRLAAYDMVNWAKPIPAQVFTGSLRDAERAALRENNSKRVFYRTGYARGWPRRRVTPGPSSVIGTAWLT
ncbi:ParB/RepB/Spo0J family partition protein [Bradyrhizobium diazoefficiens]|uniref:ParB/RepB/Spo0J family partition protein n=1 Tax=Bradyrhizobium diazoefficiens TaxID=1355477 RepID=UPI00272B94D7|nr:ParB/RepB/Spo0J family partition protein [Bradyrhizobium diazoefficiens]WLA65568.1 ParB/RepB/Spo0J family partition protein [Bradyrhizobium diazoefficiens]